MSKKEIIEAWRALYYNNFLTDKESKTISDKIKKRFKIKKANTNE